MTKAKKVVWVILLIICLGGLVFAVYNLVLEKRVYQQAVEEYQELAEEVGQQIDFDLLRAINADCVGWIRVEGTGINYPIVQGETNDTYLRTTFRKKANRSGSIFMDYRNSADFSDHNTLIYGHNMRNGSMFADLVKYQDQAFFDRHPVFMIYTPQQNYQCEVFSAYVIKSSGDSFLIDFPTDAVFQEYLQYVTKQSQLMTNIRLLPAEKIVTLSTCEYQFDEARMLVHAKLKAVDR